MGRDSFVLRVEKRSGSPLMIAKPWTRNGEDTRWASRIDDLSTHIFASKDEGSSSGFLYKASQLLEPFARRRKRRKPFMGICWKRYDSGSGRGVPAGTRSPAGY